MNHEINSIIESAANLRNSITDVYTESIQRQIERNKEFQQSITKQLKAMEITDFTEKIQRNAKYTLYARQAAQKVKSMISTNCGIDEVLVSNEIFSDIIEATGITPTIGSVYKFIEFTT
jgi:hypothetical protein